MADRGIFEIPIDTVDFVTIDYTDWMGDLPEGQLLTTVTDSWDGPDGAMSVPHETLVGNIKTFWINAKTSTVAGIFYLKLLAISDAVSPIPNYENPRILTIKLVDRTFVEEKV